MKKMVLLLSLVLTASASFANDLEVVLPYDRLNLVDATGRSCRQQITDSLGEDDLSSVKALINKMGLVWKGRNPLRLTYIKFQLSGDGLAGSHYSSVMSGAELGYVWKGRGGVVELAPSDSAQFTTPLCSIEFGGVPVVNRATTFWGEGIVTVHGTTLDGQYVSVTAQKKFQWEFRGIDRR